MPYEYTRVDISLLVNDPYVYDSTTGQVIHFGYLPVLSNTALLDNTTFAGVATDIESGSAGGQSWIIDHAGSVSINPIPANISPGNPTLAPGYSVTNADVNGIQEVEVNGTPIVAPGSGTAPRLSADGTTLVSANQTLVFAVNNPGVVVGSFYDQNNALHGYIDDHGNYTQIDVPGGSSTNVTGIDDAGDITGSYTDGNGTQHNFVGEMNRYAGIGTPIDDPTTPNNFTLTDTSNGQTSAQTGWAYSGPVAGLTSEYINISEDNLNITAHVPNSFIHSGSGEDAIDVSAVGGTNVLDGGTGSNFLVGGSGNDTFFCDDRNPSESIWSTLVNFHAGDAATIWGVTANDFSITMADNQGAAGYQGLTINAISTSPEASITLAGFSQSDIGSRLSVSYGQVDGNNYMQIQGH